MSDMPTSDTIIDHYRGDDGYVHSVDAAEALAKVVDEYAATIATLRTQLAEAKADNARLREALKTLRLWGEANHYVCLDREAVEVIDKALTPTEPSK